MDISVIETTARMGGFNVLLQTMLEQKFNGIFEVIVVDEFYMERSECMGIWEPFYFNFLHLPPKRSCSIYDDSLGINTALAAASGELIVVLADYTWVPPDYLQAHWDFYKANPGWSMSCYLDRCELPPMKGEPYSIERDWWSVFQEEFTPEWFDGREPVYRERRGSVGKVHGDGKIEIPGDYVYLLGDSVPMSVVKELNGIDERFIGGYASNDILFGISANHIGHRWALNPHVKLKKLTLSGQTQIPGKMKPKVRQPEDNYRFFQVRRQAVTEGKESPRVPDGWGVH